MTRAPASDPATPSDHAEQITNAFPDSDLEVLANAAHLANVERPDEVTELLLRHWKT